MIVAQLIFWLPFAALIYSYLLYPFLLKIIAGSKKPNSTVFSFEELPAVSILIAAHNEEVVMEEKIKSIFNSHYPEGRIEVFVGSDASTDRTDEIVENLSGEYKNLHLVRFRERSGKVNIINKLVGMSANSILIITDANVMFNGETLAELVKHFANNKIALADSHMMHKGNSKTGASLGESFYVSREVNTKYREGLLWGAMMGPFGGCYAVRKEYFRDVPRNFLVDDFYINMKVLEKGGKAISELNAFVYEDVAHKPKVEFKRKVRIATGSFQNFFAFFFLLFRPGAISFCFFSHKVIRWFGPVLFLCIFCSSCVLAYHSTLFAYVFWIEMLMLFLIPVDYIFHIIGVRFRTTHILRYFFFTNLAVFIGMFKAIGGVSSSVWEPTKRNNE